MDPNNPPLSGETNLMIWGIMFGVLTLVAVVLAIFNRKE
jgi:cytochrome c-type biogenesis protein CcmH/NrfF